MDEKIGLRDKALTDLLREMDTQIAVISDWAEEDEGNTNLRLLTEARAHIVALWGDVIGYETDCGIT